MSGIDLLNLNLSALYQFLVFLLTFFVLSQWVIKPVRKTLALRRERLQPEDAGSGLEATVAAKEKEYAEILKQVRSSSTKLRSEVRDDAVGQERGIVAEAQEKAVAKLKESQGQIQDSIEKARKEVSADVPKLAAELVRKILGRELKTT